MKKQKIYYDTTKLRDEELKIATEKAATQNEMIWLLFSQRSRDFTPSEAWELLKEKLGYPPLTSIRRGISTLTKFGLLQKTEIQRPGMYRKPEHAWKRAIEPDPENVPDSEVDDWDIFEQELFV